MEKQENKLRALDALTVYMISLTVSALIGVLAYKFIGLPALYLQEILALVPAVFVAKKTRLKSSAWLKFKSNPPRESLGGAMIYAASVLCAIPVLLWVQIIAPDFAVSCFHITDALEGHSLKYLHIILLIIISGVSEALIFEGYIYARLKKFGSPLRVCLLISAAYALFQLDLYTLVPLFIIEMGIIYVRMKTKSLILPVSLHIISATLALAVKDFATDTSQLLGTQIGALQVSGLLMIFAGAAIPTVMAGLGLMGDFRKRPLLHKAVILFAAVVLIGVGYAVTRSQG